MTMMEPWDLRHCLRTQALRDSKVATAPAPVREATAFAHILAHLPIGIAPDAQFAGEFGCEWAAAEEVAYWHSSLEKIEASAPSQDIEQSECFRHLDLNFFCRASDGGHAHTTVDYARVINHGIAGILNQVAAERANAPEPKQNCLNGMAIALRGVITWANRYAAAAMESADSAATTHDRKRLHQLAARCRQVPEYPARSFLEALQSIRLIHLAVALSEGSAASLSLGRLDQYLLSHFRRDRAKGIEPADLEAQLKEFFRLLNTFGDAACAVNVGPAVYPDGIIGKPAPENRFNELSKTIIRVVAELQLPSPILAVRVHGDTPPEILDFVTVPELARVGQPTFYGEEACRQALRRRGVPAERVQNWSVNSCMGLMMPGQEWSNMWGTVVHLLLPLELTVNHGRPFLHPLPMTLKTRAAAEYTSFDSLFAAFQRYLSEIVSLLIERTDVQTVRRGQETPNPFVSALLHDCIVRGRDRLLGGCRYHTVIVEAFGLINAADALTAIRRLVFDQAKYDLPTLTEAAKNDYADFPELWRDIQNVPKYGNGEREADEMAQRVAACFAEAVGTHSTDRISYAPSFHTLDAHIAAGSVTAASLDGRFQGMPLAKNIGTTPGRAREGHTALMRSAAAIDQAAFWGGQALDLSVDARALQAAQDRHKFQSLIRTYFALGGLQIQVNAASPELLRAAMQEPEKHQNVLVRKAGFTVRYAQLGKAEQEELLLRLEAGL